MTFLGGAPEITLLGQCGGVSYRFQKIEDGKNEANRGRGVDILA